ILLKSPSNAVRTVPAVASICKPNSRALRLAGSVGLRPHPSGALNSSGLPSTWIRENEFHFSYKGRSSTLNLAHLSRSKGEPFAAKTPLVTAKTRSKKVATRATHLRLLESPSSRKKMDPAAARNATKTTAVG